MYCQVRSSSPRGYQVAPPSPQSRDDIHEIYLADGSVLKPTANHPFYTKEKGWATISGLDEMGMGAGKLEIGDYVYKLIQDGYLQEVEIVDIISIEGKYLTYNFVDMQYGTYLTENIVTHNTGDCLMPGTLVNMANGSALALLY